MLNSRSARLSVETLEARLVPSVTVLDLTTRGAVATAPSGAIVQQADAQTHNHGKTFLRIDDRGTEHGYNTSARRNQFDEECGTRALRLDRVPVVMVDGVSYREFRLNVNQNSHSPKISLDELRIYLGDSGNLRGYNTRTEKLGGMSAAFDLDDGGNVSVLMKDGLNRSHRSADMVLLIPDAAFAGGGKYVYLYSKFGGLRGAHANGGAETWSVGCHRNEPPSNPQPATGSSISGRVLFDPINGNLDGTETGIKGVTMQLVGFNDLNEEVTQTVTTDANGYFIFTGLRAGNYVIWEEQPLVDPDDPDSQDFYKDGKDYLGMIEGTTDRTLWGVEDPPDRFAEIILGTNQKAIDYIFTEMNPD